MSDGASGIPISFSVNRNSKFSSPLATAQPLTIHSWPEALDASGSRRVCRMAIGRKARAL
jgi:hypothetical protein